MTTLCRRGLGVAIAALILTGALAGCKGRARVEADRLPTSEPPDSGPAIAILDLSGGAPEEPPTGFLGLPSKGASYPDLLDAVDRLEHEAPARGVLVRLGGVQLGLARAVEIGALLQRLGRSVPVWCHADDLGNATQYLAVRGCKRVWVSPAGSVDAIGIAAQMVYFHQLLAETLGLDVDFLQVGKYKGAEEPFTRDGPSPEARASLESTLADLRSVWLQGIRSARPSVAELAPEDGPYSAPAAKERGLVDEVGYFDAARDALEKETGAVRAEVRLGAGAGGDASDDVGAMLRSLTGGALGEAPVVVVTAVGAISMDGSGVLGEGGGISERRLVGELTRLEKDEDVRAVVLRIDSPGGSALASDLLWHQLMRVRARKPLVVSVGGMAASGGYYMASSGSVVFADEASIVGSIGVVGGKIAAAKALERLGVHADTVPAKRGDARAGVRAAYESLLVPWDDDTRHRLLETMTDIYELFVARVAEGRRIPVERVAASAEGRIFSGLEGKSLGLVDEIGGLPEAIARAKELAGLASDARVAVAERSASLLDVLLGDDGHRSRSEARALISPLRAVTPDLVPFLASLSPLVGAASKAESVLCALPFAISVR